MDAARAIRQIKMPLTVIKEAKMAKAPTNAPSKTGNPSGGGRGNNPPAKGPVNAPSKTGNPSGGGRGNNPPKGK
jgi:hypothetical protein